MYLGEVVEAVDAREIYASPRHPYTQDAGIDLRGSPQPDPTAERDHIVLAGDVPSPIDPPSGCRFHTRCRHARQDCGQRKPELATVKDGAAVACHYWRGLG